MWKLKAEERLARWRDFRKQIDQMPLDSAIEQVVEFWHGCPFEPFYLDPENPAKWPGPWELIEENWYCDLAKALGMLYTIKFTNHNPEVEIRVYYDPATRYTYNLVWINNGKYVLNLIESQVVNKTQINKNLKLKHTYSSTELNLNSY
jgi:hypothetical protein